jgi:adenylosuccinate lyase
MLGLLRAYASALKELEEIPPEVADEIMEKATRKNIGFKRSEYWEDVIHHDVRGMVRNSQESLSDRAKSFLYLGFTSNDLINTAQSMGLKDFSYEVLMPATIEYSRALLTKAMEHKDTIMVGRTHKQHAAATTAGHWMHEILGGVIPPLLKFKESTDELRGKASGFVGTNAARVLLFNAKPREIDKLYFDLIDIKPDDITGQVVHHHWYYDYFSRLFAICGGIAKFAEDVRNYQQTEVGEITEQQLSEGVGSSTGAHKINPINCENISGGQWRKVFSSQIAAALDFMTDFQRDLRDSSNKRYYIYEFGNAALYMIKRAEKVARNMTIRKERMAQNLGLTEGLICAEPLQLYLQKWIGNNLEEFIDAHEHVRVLSRKATEEGLSFYKSIASDELIQRALEDATEEEREMILDPEKYIGTTIKDIEKQTEKWQKALYALEEEIRKYKEKQRP